VGFEQDGAGENYLRPVLIVKKFNNEIFWGIPLTKSVKDEPKDKRYYYSLSFAENVISLAILSQIRLIDAKRLKYKLGDMEEKEFLETKEALVALLK